MGELSRKTLLLCSTLPLPFLMHSRKLEPNNYHHYNPFILPFLPTYSNPLSIQNRGHKTTLSAKNLPPPL